VNFLRTIGKSAFDKVYDKVLLNEFQVVGIHLDGRGLPDEIEPKQYRKNSQAALHLSFQAPERAGLDPHHGPGGYLWGQTNLQAGFESPENIVKLAVELRLVRDIEKIGDEIVLINPGPIIRVDLQKNVVRKKRLSKSHCFTPVFSYRIVAWKREGNLLPLEVHRGLFFTTWPCVRDIPALIRQVDGGSLIPVTHAKDVAKPPLKSNHSVHFPYRAGKRSLALTVGGAQFGRAGRPFSGLNMFPPDLVPHLIFR
jgi:hypothetical protein